MIEAVWFDKQQVALRYKNGKEVRRPWSEVALCRCEPSEGRFTIQFQDESRLRPGRVEPAASEAMRRAFQDTLVAMGQVHPVALSQETS